MITMKNTRRGGGGASLGRRRFIEPLLPVSSGDISEGQGFGGKATRPPVVGREMPLDPERSKRYSSQDDQLKEYLKALKMKTDQAKTVGQDTIEEENKTRSIRSNSLFLKKSETKESLESGKVDVGKAEVRPPLVAGGRASSAALQKAQFFTNKYARLPKNLPINVEYSDKSSEKPEIPVSKPTSTVIRVLSSHEDKEEDSRVSSIFNVKSFEDFASWIEDVEENIVSVENDSVKSYNVYEDESNSEILDSDSFKLELRSLGDLEDTEEEQKEERSVIVKDNAVISSVDSFPSRRTSGELESDNYSYEDDFEAKGDRYLTSATTSKSVCRSTDRRDESKVSQIDERWATKQKTTTFSRGVQTSTPDVGLGPDPSRLLYSQLHESKVLTSSFVDPQRVSSYVVSAETLRALSSYSPSVMALNEILRHQVNGTRAFLEAQRRNYVASVTNLRPDYEYTTLEKTKTLILNHRKRRK